MGHKKRFSFLGFAEHPSDVQSASHGQMTEYKRNDRKRLPALNIASIGSCQHCCGQANIERCPCASNYLIFHLFLVVLQFE